MGMASYCFHSKTQTQVSRPTLALPRLNEIQYIPGYPSNLKLKIELPLAASTVNIGTATAAIGWSETVQAQVAQVAQTHCFCYTPADSGTKKYRLTKIGCSGLPWL